VWVTNRSDELWVGVKCQSNVEIARSPRNVLRYSRGFAALGGRALLLCGGFTAYQATANSECRGADTASETVGANIHCREGNNPDRQLRPPSDGSVEKVVAPRRQPGGWLRSSHPLKSA
jgi:hypothetical protein